MCDVRICVEEMNDRRRQYAAELELLAEMICALEADAAVDKALELRAQLLDGGPLIVCSADTRGQGPAALDSLTCDRLRRWVASLPQLLAERPRQVAGPLGVCQVAYSGQRAQVHSPALPVTVDVWLSWPPQ